MRLDLANLPSDPALLQRLVQDMAEAVAHRDGEIERLQVIIKTLQRAQFGRRSERLDADQLALAFVDLEADIGRVEESAPTVVEPGPDAQPKRRPLEEASGIIENARDGSTPPLLGGAFGSLFGDVAHYFKKEWKDLDKFTATLARIDKTEAVRLPAMAE